MDIKELIEKAVKKLQSDEELLTLFKKDPVKALEKLMGVDLPDDLVEKAIVGIKAKLATEDISGALGKLKKLF